MLGDCGLAAPSMHASMADLQTGLQKHIDYAKALGSGYLVCSFPWTADSRFRDNPGRAVVSLASGITLDDWKWNAEQLNKIGAAAAKAGLRCGYHNHNMEFRSYDGVVAYDELLRLTDPELVTMEMDLAWVVTAGVDPVKYLQEARRPHLDAAREGSPQRPARDSRSPAGADHRSRQRQDRLEAPVQGDGLASASRTTSWSRRISSARRSTPCGSASNTCASSARR